MASYKPHYLPMSPPPNTVNLGDRASTYDLGEDTDIQPIKGKKDYLSVEKSMT